MSDNLYLTETTKDYYMADLEKVIAYDKSEFWKLDEGLADILIRINQSPNIQIIYSKKLTPKPDMFGMKRNSYLYIAYKNNTKEKLINTLKEIANLFEDDISIEERQPTINDKKVNEKLKGIGYFDNPNCHYINHIKIEIVSFNIKEHERFFKELENKLSKL